MSMLHTMYHQFKTNELFKLGVVLFLITTLAVTAYIGYKVRNPQSQAVDQTSVATAVEAENGSLSGAVVTVNDPNASGGKYIVFKPAIATSTPVPSVTQSPPNPTQTPTPIPTSLPLPTSTPSSSQTRILCDGKTYDGFSSTIFKLDGGEGADGSIQKIIRNCIFRNGTARAIVLKNAKNVLIENNTFQNIRSNQPGIGTHGIAVSPDSVGVVDTIVIRGNYFTEIGADGIQVGEGTGIKISNFTIDNNTFIGDEAWGENAIDIKGTIGPIVIRNNDLHGFRECQSPKRGGNQDCSGSPGEGMVIHQASNGNPDNILVENNRIHDNQFGLSISNLGPNSIIVRNNIIYDNRANPGIGLLVNNSSNVQLSGNSYTNNNTNCSGISPCQ
ncbi:right-handed parallel beta-helix repeat-containing protein [Candidatus Gottesmanbacteria bacterium]|nr:right-handed parallel beta-helix repeat-containing protein [Candidatus Gottesmanbacteria bacterium]